MKNRIRATVALAAAAALALSACGSSDDSGTPGSNATLHIVGFAVPEQANKAIAAEWNKTDAGKGGAQSAKGSGQRRNHALRDDS